jgi:hypothetical protein
MLGRGEGAPTLVGKNCQIQLVRTDPEPSLIFGIGTGTRTLHLELGSWFYLGVELELRFLRGKGKLRKQ